MRVLLENVGPVGRADLELKPLTVFIGPNNTGKSIAASMLYAVTGVWHVSALRGNLARLLRDTVPGVDGGVLPRLAELLEEASSPSFDELPPEIRAVMEAVAKKTLLDYLLRVEQEVERVTATSLHLLMRAPISQSQKRQKLGIQIHSGWTGWITSIGADQMHSFSHSRKREIIALDVGTVWSEINQTGWNAIRDRVERGAEVLPELVLGLMRTCFHEFPRRAWYLPAARSGLMQFSYRDVAGAIIRESSRAVAAPEQMVRIGGTIADFLGQMVELSPDARGDFEAGAALLEQEVLSGVIDVLPSELGGLAEVRYRSPAGSLPLTRTSSMVAEVAPVVVYLRHLLKEGDLLFVEEPEAHLHPSAQVAFARSVVRLVKNGLRVGITTHSEFFLQQLNNAIMAEAVDPEDAERIGYKEELRLSHNDVAAYLFTPTDNDGTVVEPLPVTAKMGILETGFAEVSERLYRESVALEYRSGD